MNTAILYGSPTKLTNGHAPVHRATGLPQMHQPPYYVRMEVVHLDPSVALTKAKPMEGEIVLNTVELEDPEMVAIMECHACGDIHVTHKGGMPPPDITAYPCHRCGTSVRLLRKPVLEGAHWLMARITDQMKG